MLLVRGALILLTTALCTACASTASRLDAGEFRQRPVSGAQRVGLESEGDEIGFIEIASGGVFLTQLGSQRVRVVHVRLTVRNGGQDDVRVPLDQLAIEGIGGRRLRPAAVYGERDPNATSIVVPAGEIRSTDIVFTLPSGISVDDVGGFSLFWGVDVPGDVIRKATLFAPADVGEHGALARGFRPATHAE